MFRSIVHRLCRIVRDEHFVCVLSSVVIICASILAEEKGEQMAPSSHSYLPVLMDSEEAETEEERFYCR